MSDKTLQELEQLLFGWNYEVFLRVYESSYEPDLSAEQLVSKIIPNSTVRDIEPIEPGELIGKIESCLRYEGTPGAGPEVANIKSERFDKLFGEFKAYLTDCLSTAENVWTFWFKDGHPAYPVFWEMSALIVGPVHTLLVVMSSSD